MILKEHSAPRTVGPPLGDHALCAACIISFPCPFSSQSLRGAIINNISRVLCFPICLQPAVVVAVGGCNTAPGSGAAAAGAEPSPRGWGRRSCTQSRAAHQRGRAQPVRIHPAMRWVRTNTSQQHLLFRHAHISLVVLCTEQRKV